MKRVYLFFGAPGSGKGTQSEMFAEVSKLPVISTGDLLRHEEKIHSKLGNKVAQTIDAGKLVEDSLIWDILKKRLNHADCEKGFILDGFPRDEEQMKDVLAVLKKGDKLVAIDIEVSDKEVLNRLGGRRVCDCGETYHLLYKPPKKAGICDKDSKKLYLRHDDKPEVIKARLKKYHQEAKKLLDMAGKKGDIVVVNGQKDIDLIRKAIINKLRVLQMR